MSDAQFSKKHAQFSKKHAQFSKKDAQISDFSDLVPIDRYKLLPIDRYKLVPIDRYKAKKKFKKSVLRDKKWFPIEHRGKKKLPLRKKIMKEISKI